MSDEREDESPRRLPLAEPARRKQETTRYSPAVLMGIAEGEARALASYVRKSPADAVLAAQIASERAEQLCAGATLHEPPIMPIACRRGCSTCCQAKVLVVAPEVLRIADYLRASRTNEELAALKSRLQDLAAALGGLTRNERAEAHVPCPLLDADGGCGVHPVRPLVCRSWTSYDASACERYWEAPTRGWTPPQWAQGYEITQAVLAGLGKACEDEGREGKPLEFLRALSIALSRPNAAQRWFDRLPVFATARDAEWGASARSQEE